jgi:hypothetical protein
VDGKLRINQDRYPTEDARMYYVYSQTAGDAQKHLYPRYRRGATDPFVSADEMLDYLKGILTDPDEAREAKWKYDRLTMTLSETFFEFKTKLLHLAGVAGVPRESLRIDLFDRLTPELRRSLVPQLHTLVTLQSFTDVAGQVDAELKRINKERVPKGPRQPLTDPNRDRSGRFQTAKPSPMRALPAPTVPKGTTPVPPTNPSRQATPAVEKLTCYNCGELGHMASQCPQRQRQGNIHEIEEVEGSVTDDTDEDALEYDQLRAGNGSA